jgi:hypothetical protein
MACNDERKRTDDSIVSLDHLPAIASIEMNGIILDDGLAKRKSET